MDHHLETGTSDNPHHRRRLLVGAAASASATSAPVPSTANGGGGAMTDYAGMEKDGVLTVSNTATDTNNHNHSHGTAVIAESHTRSLLKGLTWRILATSTTTIIAYIITGQIDSALRIGFLEFFAKLAIYYAHERIWTQIRI